MIQRFNEYNNIFESALKNAKQFADKYTDVDISSSMYDAIKRLLSKKVKSKYCHKNDNYHLALLFLKIGLEDEIKVFSVITDAKDSNGGYDYNDNLIDEILNKNDNSLETLLCYLLKYDRYLNYLPIKPIAAYTEKNVRKYHQETGGNTNTGVYETLTDHLLRYLPIKLQSNDWVKNFPSKIKSDFKQNQDKYETEFLSLFNSYNALPNDEKKAIYQHFFGKQGENGKISRFDDMGEFLVDFKAKLSGNNDIDKLVEEINNYGDGISIVHNDNNIIITTITSYRASVDFGKDTSWCISDASSDYQYNNYCGYEKDAVQYFIWNFNKEISDDLFRVGVTVNENGSIRTAHDKADSWIDATDYFKNELKLSTNKILKPLSKREKNKRTKIKEVNNTFSKLVRNGKSENSRVNHNKAVRYFKKYMDTITFDNDEFLRNLYKFGDIELIKSLRDRKKIKYNQTSGNYHDLPIETAYIYNKEMFDFLFEIDEAFKQDGDDYYYTSSIRSLFKAIEKQDDFKKLYNRFKEVNGDDLDLNNYVFGERGFLDRIIQDDDIDMLMFYINTYGYEVPEDYHPNNVSGTYNTLKYIYDYGNKSGDDHHDNKSVSKIASYLINSGYKDDEGVYTILTHITNDTDRLQKIIDNGYSVPLSVYERIFNSGKEFKKFELLDKIGYDYAYDVDNMEIMYNINRFFKDNNIENINSLLNKNMNFIYYTIRNNYHNSDKLSLQYYLEKETNTTNAINVFNNIHGILSEFTKDENIETSNLIKKNHYELFFDYAWKNNLIDIFKHTIKYKDNINKLNVEYDGGNPELVKIIIEHNHTLINKVTDMIRIYYNYELKDKVISIFSDSEYLADTLDNLIHYDKKRELLSAIRENGYITDEVLSEADITFGIYVTTKSEIEYFINELGGKPKKKSISDYIEYGVKDTKLENNTPEGIDLEVKSILELLFSKGASFVKGRFNDDNGTNAMKLVEKGLTQSTKFAIDNGAKYNLVEEKSGQYYHGGDHRIMRHVLESNNISLFNYFINDLGVELTEKDYSNMSDIKRSMYNPNTAFFDTINNYRIKHNIDIDSTNMLMLHIKADDIKIIKHVYHTLGDINPTYVLGKLCSSTYYNQNIDIIKWLVNEEDADVESVYDKYKRSKTFKDKTRDFFKMKIKEKRKNENIDVLSFKDYINLN